MIKQIAYESVLFIYLMTNTGEMIKKEIMGMSCESWFKYNVEQVEKKRVFKEPLTIHMYKDKVIVGYVCSDNLPK